MKFNTAIAALMTLLNQFYDKGSVNRAELKTYLQLLNPFAPHMTEEIWAEQNFGGMVCESEWPSYDEAKCVDDVVEIAVQVNGKVRARISVASDISKDDAIAQAMAEERVKAYTDGKNVVKSIYIPGRLVNLVVK